jgi:hypothetical protein
MCENPKNVQKCISNFFFCVSLCFSALGGNGTIFDYFCLSVIRWLLERSMIFYLFIYLLLFISFFFFFK